MACCAEAMTGALAAGRKQMDLFRVVMGLITGVFSGVIRDILCNQVPLIFKKELYAVISLLTAGLYIILKAYQLTEWISLVICLSMGFSLRMLALRYHWSMPTFDYQANSDQQTH